MSDNSTGTTRLQNLSHAHWQAAVLQAALKLELFTAISEGAREISQIAQKIAVNPEKTQCLIDVCSSLGLIELRGGLYYNAPDVERHAVKGNKSYIGPWLMQSEEAFKSWADITPRLKSNEPPLPHGIYEEAWMNTEAACLLNRSTYNIGLASGYRLAHRFDFAPYSLLLDLGGGSGAYCIAICSTCPNMRAIVIDYPAICTAAEEIIAEAGLSDRITTHPGDLLEVDFPPDADLMLMSSNLPNFTSFGLATVYRKAFNAMKKGGAIIILGEALADDRSGPLGPALWNLDECLRRGIGEGHTMSEVCNLLKEAGFTDCQVSDWVPGMLTKFVAHKPR